MQKTILDIPRWVALNVWRDGGQRGARGNAWAAMASDKVRSRQREEVDAALQQLTERPLEVAHR